MNRWSSDRTQDSIEQIEGQELPNPITDREATLGEAGDAMNPEGEAPEEDKDHAEGPVPTRPRCPARGPTGGAPPAHRTMAA